MTNGEFVKNLILVLNRDLSALQKIYDGCFQKLFSTALFILRNRDDAYDVATDVILKLCEYSGDPNKIENYSALLYKMARNRALDYVRKNSRNLPLVGHEAATLERDCLWLEDIYSALTEPQRELFVRHVVWGVKLRDIAAQSGVPYITVKRRYAEVKARIKKLYGRG